MGDFFDMTIAQANDFADRVKSLPKLYDTPPTLTEGMRFSYFSTQPGEYYPWVKTSSYLMSGRYYGKADNLYDCRNGFSQAGYSKTITDWEATSTKTYQGTPRYITIDDLRMMAYVGIEYARAKLDGWRYRYGELGEDASFFQKGCVVRLADGRRYVHRSGGNVTAPPGSGGPSSDQYYSYKFWTPVMRMPGFGVPETGGFGYPEEFEMPSEAYTGILQLGTLEGNGDIVKFDVERTAASYAVGGDVYRPCIASGSMEVILSLASSLSEDDVEESLIPFQLNAYPIYYVWDNEKLRQKGEAPWRTENDPIRTSDTYSVQAVMDGIGGYVPLKKGVTYNVFAKFTNAVLRKYEGTNLVTYTRITTRMLAPYAWPGDTDNAQQTN